MDSILARVRPVAFGVLIALLAAGALWLIGRPPRGKPVTLLPPAPTTTPRLLRVYVSGEVAAPGVYSFPPGSIVQDAVLAAGGPTRQGDPARLNLAALLSDGQQIVVPSTAQPAPPADPLTAAAPPSPSNKVNLNTATAVQLEALPEVGPATAARIVEYRTTHGPFKKIDEIMEVSGIGPATFGAIKDLIAVQ